MVARQTVKAGLTGLSVELAVQWARHRIRVNTVVPGWVMTERQKALEMKKVADAELPRARSLDDRAFNVGTGIETSVNDLASMLVTHEEDGTKDVMPLQVALNRVPHVKREPSYADQSVALLFHDDIQ